MQENKDSLALRAISIMIALIAFILGLLASVAALSGDEYGRVNLLLSLFLFTLLPAFGLLATAVFLSLGRRSGIAALLVELRVTPRRFAALLARQGGAAQRQRILFSLSQGWLLSFIAGNLLGFALMLLAMDISFVWRSTLLEASDLLPVLDFVAMPWSFWSAAQPSLEMLSQTQDFRLQGSPNDANYVGQWWRFLLAAQLCYSLLPRTLLWLIGKNRRTRKTETLSTELNLNGAAEKPISEIDRLAESVTEIPVDSILFDLAHTPDSLLSDIGERLQVATIHRTPVDLHSQLQRVDYANSPALVVLVRSWEPPLAELADSLREELTAEQQSNLFIAPIDWVSAPQKNERLVEPQVAHTQEWRRFCASAVDCTHLSLYGAKP
ncbi:MAG: DUF2868 domain-containing protein [Pseudohongiellaceae bacterium]